MIQKTSRISAIILAKDEEDRIGECIRSLSFCDEIIVVDNGSTDNTVDIAKKLNAQVISLSCTSFADLRNVAMKDTTAEWLLYVDADELVSHELQISMLGVLQENTNEYAAFRIQRVNKYLGVEFPQVEHIIRFMKRLALVRWVGEVHETALIRGRVGDLMGVLRHDTHRTLTHMVEKTNTWSQVEATLRFNAGHPPIVWWRIIRVMITGFYDAYIKKGGFKVGSVGFIESMYQSFSMFITYAKLYELQHPISSAPEAGLRGAGK